MTIIQIQYFLTVCKYENFTRAAEEFHISQPAMSGAIKEIEKECGCTLFKRDKNSLKITEEGKVLRDEAALVLNQFEKMENVVTKLSLRRKYIKISFSTFSGNQIYPDLLGEFARRCPDIEIFSVEDSTDRQFELLDRHLTDLAITVRFFNDPAERARFDEIYAHYPLKRSRQCFCVHAGHPLAKEKFVTMEQIAGEKLVMLKDGFNQTAGLKNRFKKLNLDVKVIHYTSQMYTVERFIEKNAAAGFLPEEVAERNPAIVPIPYEGSEMRAVEIFWRKDHYLYKAVRDFISLAKEMYPAER
ncbi:MAG TPA: LysR family transcriptional regulator [Candidatus Lachnoclostridium pullistercoris]|uniref:LysR family transcriptional regulator n=1 Tax=Candidatus Lachnoclostridium pullistercoris TaxID=2838632 RepID=A0A9D2PEE1_9FIRM|nr:LysR family transcriptional regulator [Candidatus Lachnoclostridium pullistercoris]